MIRMLLLTLLFFFGPALLMFAAHRATMMFRFWWKLRQHRHQQAEGIIDITPTGNHNAMRPDIFFIGASMMVATLCAFIAWQSMAQQPALKKNHYIPAHLDADGQLVPAQSQPSLHKNKE